MSLEKLVEKEKPEVEEEIEEEREDLLEADLIKPGGTPVEILAIPEPGRWYLARVTKVLIGTFADFFDIDKIIEKARARGDQATVQAWLEKKDKKAVMIEYIIEGLGLRGRDVMSYSMYSNSRMFRILNCQGIKRDDGLTLKPGDLILVYADFKTDPHGNKILRLRIDCPPVQELQKLHEIRGELGGEAL